MVVCSCKELRVGGQLFFLSSELDMYVTAWSHFVRDNCLTLNGDSSNLVLADNDIIAYISVITISIKDTLELY